MADELLTIPGHLANNQIHEDNATEDVDSSTPVPQIPETTPHEDRPRRRMIRNFSLVWIDSSFDKSTLDYEDIITQLESIFDNVHTCAHIELSVDIIKKIVNENVFVIVSSCLSEQLIPLIHDLSQIEVIYIFGSEIILPREWAKVKNVYLDLGTICETLGKDVKQCNRNNISLSFVPSTDGTTNPNLDQLDPSFMYTQIFKEILFSNAYDRKSIEDFLAYCRQQNQSNRCTLNLIAKFEVEYHSQAVILWYTKYNFIYEVLNRALRNLEADTIIKMGFFINDLHQYIKQLYSEQTGMYGIEPFTVYRGQGLLRSDFQRLLKSTGGLISFNCFLSTSTDIALSNIFIESNSSDPNKVGILFKITIDPSISSSPYASIRHLSQFSEEEEILFSMHTVFRIVEIKQLDDHPLVWQVDLKSTSDEDQQLSTLTEQIREETSGSTVYERLGKLLTAIGQFEKAEELYMTLLDETVDMTKQSIFYQQLGDIRDKRGDYQGAILFYEKGIKIRENIQPVDNLELGKAYILLGAIYMKIDDFQTGTLMQDKGIGILYKIMPSSHPDLVISYIDSGRASYQTSEHSEALFSHEAMLELSETTLPANHPHLAASYNNIGIIYHNVGDSLKALTFYQKALEIFQKTLPENHPSLATSYNNIGAVYKNAGEYSKASSYYEKSLDIRRKTLPSTHQDLAGSYGNIGMMYQALGEYAKALTYQEKSLEIQYKTLSPNHSDLGITYMNIAIIYQSLGEYSKALLFHEKSIEMRQKTLPPYHPDLANSYTNIGIVYQAIGEYCKALSYHEKSIEILQKTLPPNHSDFANSYANIGVVYHAMSEYLRAMEYCEKSLEIRQKTLPANHPDLASSYAVIGIVEKDLGDSSKAMAYQEKSLEIRQKTFPPNHPDLADSYANIGKIYQAMGECSKALSYHEKSLEMRQKILPSDHPSIAHSYICLGRIYDDIVEHSRALDFFERAMDILERKLPFNHPDLQTVRKDMELVRSGSHMADKNIKGNNFD